MSRRQCVPVTRDQHDWIKRKLRNTGLPVRECAFSDHALLLRALVNGSTPFPSGATMDANSRSITAMVKTDAINGDHEHNQVPHMRHLMKTQLHIQHVAATNTRYAPGLPRCTPTNIFSNVTVAPRATPYPTTSPYAPSDRSAVDCVSKSPSRTSTSQGPETPHRVPRTQHRRKRVSSPAPMPTTVPRSPTDTRITSDMNTLMRNDPRLSAILLVGATLALIGLTAMAIFILILLHLLVQYAGQAVVPDFLKTTAS